MSGFEFRVGYSTRLAQTEEAVVPEAIQYQFESDIGYAGVTQLEEVTVSKSVKCEFKSHHL